MKLKYYLEYIGETEKEFKNKAELFKFYYEGRGNISPIGEDNRLPFIQEFLDDFDDQYYVGSVSDYRRICIHDSIEEIIESIKRAREYNIRTKKEDKEIQDKLIEKYEKIKI